MKSETQDGLLGKRAALDSPDAVQDPAQALPPNPLNGVSHDSGHPIKQAIPANPNSFAARTDLTPEQIFANELAMETAKTAAKEMFDFEFVFNQSENYKQSYYCRKFGCASGDYEQLIFQIKKSYIAGIVWNYQYYYRKCVSWNWFYPYYYAPLISDLCNFSCLKFEFSEAQPFRPFEQLLAVLPPYSAHALPSCFKELMEEETSTIVDFYPVDFHVDLAGKRFAWLGEVILPFVEDDRLRKAFGMIEGKLSAAEVQRNTLGKNFLFFVEDNTLLSGKTRPIQVHQAFTLSHFISGLISDTRKLKVCEYQAPDYVPHRSALLNGLKLQKSDFYYTVGL